MALRDLNYLAVLFGAFFFIACQTAPVSEAPPASADPKAELPPDQRFGELFVAVQTSKVFPDGKTFVDCTPKFITDTILARYEARKDDPAFDLESFVEAHFELPEKPASGFTSDTSRSAAEHINALWPVLTRRPQPDDPGSILPLPHPYVVPGGRFGEIYYWDSYFTMLGLQTAGKVGMIENMVDNFSFLLDTIGFIPNGNRTYFLSRSQPPFYALMVGLLAEERGDDVYRRYLPFLETEYTFWMAGADQLGEKGDAHRRVVALADGQVLNRYWDDRNVPRAEMYHDDVKTAEHSTTEPTELFRHLRAACESGWDFSSRWLADEKTLATIHTADIIPVDLNALLYQLEMTIAHAYELQGDTQNQAQFADRAEARRIALLEYCWDPVTGFFTDYDFVAERPTGVLSLAGMFPLFFKMAEPEQAEQAARVIERFFLKPGGVVTTLNPTGQQWDAPNGWAPLQWITIQGLRHYGEDKLAEQIKTRWIDLNLRVYRNTGKMVEKYNVEDMSLDAGGGEYPVQDGFGWTNGVLLRLLNEEG